MNHKIFTIVVAFAFVLHSSSFVQALDHVGLSHTCTGESECENDVFFCIDEDSTGDVCKIKCEGSNSKTCASATFVVANSGGLQLDCLARESCMNSEVLWVNSDNLATYQALNAEATFGGALHSVNCSHSHSCLRIEIEGQMQQRSLDVVSEWNCANAHACFEAEAKLHSLSLKCSQNTDSCQNLHLTCLSEGNCKTAAMAAASTPMTTTDEVTTTEDNSGGGSGGNGGGGFDPLYIVAPLCVVGFAAAAYFWWQKRKTEDESPNRAGAWLDNYLGNINVDPDAEIHLEHSESHSSSRVKNTTDIFLRSTRGTDLKPQAEDVALELAPVVSLSIDNGMHHGMEDTDAILPKAPVISEAIKRDTTKLLSAVVSSDENYYQFEDVFYESDLKKLIQELFTSAQSAEERSAAEMMLMALKTSSKVMENHFQALLQKAISAERITELLVEKAEDILLLKGISQSTGVPMKDKNDEGFHDDDTGISGMQVLESDSLERLIAKKELAARSVEETAVASKMRMALTLARTKMEEVFKDMMQIGISEDEIAMILSDTADTIIVQSEAERETDIFAASGERLEEDDDIEELFEAGTGVSMTPMGTHSLEALIARRQLAASSEEQKAVNRKLRMALTMAPAKMEAEFRELSKVIVNVEEIVMILLHTANGIVGNGMDVIDFDTDEIKEGEVFEGGEGEGDYFEEPMREDSEELYEAGGGHSVDVVVDGGTHGGTQRGKDTLEALIAKKQLAAGSGEDKLVAKKLRMALTLTPAKMEEEFRTLSQMGAKPDEVLLLLMGTADEILIAKNCVI